MPAPPIPVDRYLTPDDAPAAPDGFSSLTQKVSTGIPLPISLDADFTAVLVVPTGLAGEWQTAPPAAVLSTSAAQSDPHDPAAAEPIGDVERSTARLLIQRRGANVASIPLALGLQVSVPADGGNSPGRLEVMVVSWDLRAGCMVGVGDYGASITLAWRRNDTGVQVYGPVPLNPFLRLRLPPMIKLRSSVALNLLPRIYDRLRISVPEVLR